MNPTGKGGSGLVRLDLEECKELSFGRLGLGRLDLKKLEELGLDRLDLEEIG